MKDLVVKIIEGGVKLPDTQWVDATITDPNEKGRVLVSIYGHSGRSSWLEGLMTLPASSIISEEAWYKELREGFYRVVEAQDKKGRTLYRFYPTEASNEAMILASFPGIIVPEASEGAFLPLIGAEGYSRSGRHGSRWLLVSVSPGTNLAIEPFGQDDPVYYRVDENNIVFLGSSDAVLPPSEW